MARRTRRSTRRFDADQRADPTLPDPRRAAEIANNRPSSVNNRNSRYVQGGDTVIFPTRLGFWERRIIEPADDDIPIVIPSDFDRRPDLMAFNVYGRQQLTWLVLQFNNISDINTEFIAGREILLPSPARVLLDILNQPTNTGLDPEQNIPTSAGIMGSGRSNNIFSPNNPNN